MGDNCSDCLQAKLIQKLDDRIIKIEEKCQSVQDKISELEKDTAVNEEQTKMVFKILNEIKDSIKLIADKIDFLENRPGENWNELIKAIVLVVVTAAVTYLIKK